MKATIHINSRVTKNKTLLDVIRQFKSYDNPTEVDVYIKTNGGNKEEGDDIYNYLKNIGVNIPVTTHTDRAYSIGAKIFAAGSERLVKNKPDVLGIHFARVTTNGDFTAEELEELTDKMFSFKNEFINFYSDHLNIDKDTVSALLNNETLLSGEQAVSLGFATGIEDENEIIAELNIHKNNETMTEKKKEAGFFKKLIADIQAYLNEGVEVNAELILQNSNGDEVIFPELAETDAPTVGDAATINGQPANGKYIMPSMEDQTFVFVDGKLTEILPKQESEPEPTQEEPVAEEQPQETFAELLGKVTEKVKAENKAEIEASYKTIIAEKEAEISELKKKIGSKEIVAEEKEEQSVNIKPKNKAAEILQAAKQFK